MFRTVPLSIMRSFSLYTQHWYLSYRFADSLQARSCSQAVGMFYSKNKFEKLVLLVGFMIRISINFFDYMKARIISACCLVALVLIEMIEPSS